MSAYTFLTAAELWRERGVEAYDVSVNVVFFAGAEFDPPPPLGTTGRTRYVKVKTLGKIAFGAH